MYDFIFKHKKIIQIFLWLAFIPFAFFWVGDYVRDAGPGVGVARVGDYEISQEEFARGLRERQDAIRRSAEGGRVDPELLDSPQLRQATLEGLIHRRVLLDRAFRSGLVVTDTEIDRFITEATLFHGEDGKYSKALAEQYLKSEGLTAATFRARLRQDAVIQQLSAGLAGASVVPKAVVDRIARLSAQSREVSHATISPQRFLAQVKLEPDAAKKQYDANPASYRTPEQVRVEYVTLSLAALMDEVQLDAEEARKTYEATRSQYGVEESRQTAHILITAEAGAGPGAKEKARARADEIYRALQKKPDGFAEAARKHSQDPGSAAQGGDLGAISRGMMKDVPEFEAAVFGLKAGEISPPVESKLGFHIIRVASIRPAQIKPFEDVRTQIETDLKRDRAGRRFAELANTFGNVVYEQSESLKPAAELIKAAPKQSGWITRERAEPPLDHPRLLAAVFSDEVLKDRRNTEAIEVAPGTLVSARLVEHKPAAAQPFEAVRPGIELQLRFREAARLAAEEGRRQLEALRAGKPAPGVEWSAPLQVTREGHKDIPEPVLQLAFRTDVSTLPAHAGTETPRGAYILLRVTRAQEIDTVPPERLKQITEQLRAIYSRETLTAYVDSLKQKAGVTISKDALEKK